MLQYEQFEENVRRRLEQLYGEGSRVVVCNMRKNNGIILRGLSAYVPDRRVVPTIYPKDFYERYCEGMPFEDVFREIEDTVATGYETSNVDVEYYKVYESAKDTLRLKMINYESNRAFLQEVPCRRFLDLALVCYSQVPGDMPWYGTITVNHDHLCHWDISEDELFDKAQENSCGLDKWALLEMESLLRAIQPEDDCVEDAPEGEYPDMYVLTNHSKVNGACVVCYPDVLKRCAEVIKSDFYVLPSSIHELILVKMWNQGEEELQAMVREVNEEQLREEEVLSYHVYRYCISEGYLVDIVTGEKEYM